MDQIRLTGIRATGKHGVLDFEHERAQTFVVDATLFLDLAAAGRSDDLNDTVDYGAIAKGIVAIIEGEHVDLIEKLANRIVGMILGFPAVCRTQVTVHKPNAPITVPFDDVSVTVERSRETVDSPSCERSSEHGQVHHAIIAMGGNQGDVTATLRDAVRCIDGLPSTQVTGVSPLYRTDAWGMPEGTAEFRNAVVSVDTRLSAAELLAGLQRIEASHGRVRTDHWTSRTLDLDIIDFDGQESADPDLTLPHPRAWQRAFVLVPWAALDPEADLPGMHGGPVGELADGLYVDLNKVSKKYEGLDGTELAISESQERMAVDVAAEDVDEFLGYAKEENLEAEVIATVTEDPRMTMVWNGDTIVDLSREFLASNGAPKHQVVHVEAQHGYTTPWASGTLSERMHTMLTDLNVASNKGLSERFDSTIGAGTVLMPFGGRKQLTPNMAMVAKLPVFGETTTASAMAWGFNPYIMEQNQFAGAYLSVVESLSKLVAAGFEHEKAYLSFQEYFEKLRDEPERWGKPMAAVLGALMAQVDLGAGAIGGKDSMSGTFEQLDVPPTLISFAVAVGNMKRATSPEFKGAGHRVVRIAPRYHSDGLTPDKDSLLEVFSAVEELTDFGDALAVSTPGYGATAEAIFKMTVGNQIGVKLADGIAVDDLFAPAYGSFIIELADNAKVPAVSNLVEVSEVGETTEEYSFVAAGETLDLAELQDAWEGGIESVFPYRSKGDEKGKTVETVSFDAPKKTVYTGTGVAKPHVIIPVFPGNNCEYDSAAAFERAGADVSTLIVNNLTPAAVAESTNALVEEIKKSQIIMIPGGFSGGDEPDGSAKFITAFFRAPAVTEAVRDLLNNRDGLMLGICNGFQALIKLGLVPYGDIVPMTAECPTLTFNTIGRHQSRLVRTRVASNLSPWLAKTEVGDMHTIAISHGEGRFVASDDVLAQLKANGQIATQYVDEAGVPGMDLDVNPNGSLLAIEGITSPDGRVFGKMGHSERYSNGTFVNVPGEKDQPLFAAGVEYFTV